MTETRDSKEFKIIYDYDTRIYRLSNLLFERISEWWKIDESFIYTDDMVEVITQSVIVHLDAITDLGLEIREKLEQDDGE